MTNRSVPLGIFVAATILSGAMAQDAKPTPENAQKFLTITAGQGTMTAYVGRIWYTKHLDAAHICKVGSPERDCPIETNENGKVTGMSSSDLCTTSVALRWDDLQLSQSYATPEFRNRTRPIDWAKVITIEASNSTVNLTGGGDISQLYVGSEDLAKRVAYAAQTLQQRCDPAAATGF